jgi:molybdenum cofactor cytidylyltransferase
MDVGGSTALAAIIKAALRGGVEGAVVVGGANAELLKAAVAHRLQDIGIPVVVAANPEPERGMMSSIRVGVRAVPDGIAVLVWPVDHPFVSHETVRELLAACDSDIVVPECDGTSGHPTFFAGALVPLILALDDAGGLNRLVHRYPERVRRLTVDDPGVTVDVDRPDDLVRGLELVGARSRQSRRDLPPSRRQ